MILDEILSHLEAHPFALPLTIVAALVCGALMLANAGRRERQRFEHLEPKDSGIVAINPCGKKRQTGLVAWLRRVGL
jgi:hypothetical protein